MAKKTFRGGLDGMLDGNTRPVAPVSATPEPPADSPAPAMPALPANRTAEGCKPGERRFTVILPDTLIAKLKALAELERVQVKDLAAAALERYFADYESKKGPIHQPEKRSAKSLF